MVLSMLVSATGLTVPELPVKSKLYFSDTPLFNKPVEVILEISSTQDIDDIQAKIILDNTNLYRYNVSGVVHSLDGLLNSFELTDGTLIWNGKLSKNQRVVIKAMIIGKEEGYYKVKSIVSASFFESNTKEIFAKILLNKKGKILNEFPKNEWSSNCGGGIIGSKINFSADYDFTITSLPKLNNPVGLILTLTPKEDLSNFVISLSSPPKGFDLISVETSIPQKDYGGVRKGNISISDNDPNCPVFISWMGDLKKDELLKIKAGLYVNKPGWGYFNFGVNNNDIERINFLVDEEFSKILIDERFSKKNFKICEMDECNNLEAKLREEFIKKPVQKEMVTNKKSNFFRSIFDFIKSLFK